MPRLLGYVWVCLLAGCSEPEPIDPIEPPEPTFLIDFRLFDQHGESPPQVAVTCSYSDLQSADSGGEVRPISWGDHEFSCEVPESTLSLSVSAEGRRGDLLSSFVRERVSIWTTEIADVIVWIPEITVEEVGDQVVVTWDAPPPTPGPGWTLEQWVGVSPNVQDVAVGPDATTASFPRASLGNDPTARVRLRATFDAGVPGFAAASEAPAFVFEHTP